MSLPQGEGRMASYTLTDVAHDLWVDSFSVGSGRMGLWLDRPWSVSKRTLRGGMRDGVDLIEVDNGALRFSVIPTRGMGIWKGAYEGDRLGWDSPIAGPVNPAYVNLMNWGGLGWLEGFDELLARCGLENNGSPYGVKSINLDGSERHTTYGLHGKIANTPASYVQVRVNEAAPYEIVVEGHVEESAIFCPQIRMATTITTTHGSNRVTVRDEFINLRDSPSEMQMLYHWNFSTPYMEAGSRMVAPVKVVAPRDPRAQEGIDQFDVYGPPDPGSTEQVYFHELHSAQEDSATLAMLRNQAGDKAVVLRFFKDQMPAFTVWKNHGGVREGYVTGLEPATNYPNPKPVEKARGRVVPLAVGGRYVIETTLEVLNTREGVAGVEAEIEALQRQGARKVHRTPTEPFSPAS
jgi:hypothetical protein